jgi:hypothetical protein
MVPHRLRLSGLPGVAALAWRFHLPVLRLCRGLEIGSYQTAWAMLGRLRPVLVRPGRDLLAGTVEVDETYIGGEEPVGFQNSATGPDLGFYAARSYSLMRPPRTGRRLICFWVRSATGWSGRGGGDAGCGGGAARCNGPRTGPGWSADAVRRRSASGR